MKFVSIFMLMSLMSCSTLKKTLIYGGLSGGIAGAAGGYALSPDEESRPANAAIFGLLGAGLAAILGYSMYSDDPRNQKLNHMLMPKKLKDNEMEIDLGGIKIDASLEKKGSFKTPRKELPEKLKGKVKEQFIIKYESKERYVNKGNKTFYVPSFEIYEHAYKNLEEK